MSMLVTRHSRLLGGLLATALVLIACTESGPTGSVNASDAPAGTPIAAVEIQPRDLSRSLNTSGTVEARVRIRLASRTSGTVDQVYVDVGDRVAAGDALVELDVSEEQAELRRARAQADEARINYQRTAELRERGVNSPADYERALAQLQVADSEQALWQTRVAFGRIHAPRNAVITARHVEPGEAVQAQDTLFELSAMDTLIIPLAVSELDIRHLQVDQPVPITLDALPDAPLEGRIQRIHPAADATNRLITVDIALPADAADQGVRPGYLGRVHLTIDQRPDALAVPAAAVGEHDDGRYVYLVQENRLQRRMIEPGVTRGDWTEVLSGLEPGDVVLATNPIEMQDGQQVRIVGWRG